MTNKNDIGSSLDENGNEVPDGFRPPRNTRPKGWLEKAIADGSVRDPNAPDPDAGKDYAGAVVVQPPTGSVEADRKD